MDERGESTGAPAGKEPGHSNGPKRMNSGGAADRRDPDPRLRERAEGMLDAGQPDKWGEHLSQHEVMRLVHELQVHQIELELQNEELRHAQIELAVSAERYADLYDFAPVGYLSVGLDGQIVRANLAAAALLGAERTALLGKSLFRFVAVDHLHRFHQLRRRLVVAGLTESTEFLLQPLEGNPFWARFEIVTRQDNLEGLVLWQVAISNIDAQKRAELMLQNLNEELDAQVQRRTEQLTLANRQLLEEIRLRQLVEAELRDREELLERRVAERTAELAALLAVARDVSSTMEIDAIQQIVLAELKKIVSYEGCAIFMLQGNVLTLSAYEGPLQRDELLQSQTTLDDSPLLRAVISTREPLIVPDITADDPLASEWRQRAGALQRHLMGKSRSWLGVPMIVRGQPIGVLRLDHPQPGYFTQQHIDVVWALAGQAAISIINARLFSQAQRVAAIEERQRLARELHDSVAQTFYSIALSANGAKARLEGEQELVGRRLNHIIELTEVGLAEMKALIFELQAEGIQREGLVQALRRHIDALVARNDVRVNADLGEEPQTSLTTKEAVYGIVREALQNVIRHASATELWVQLRRSDDSIEVEVRDNGKGFTAETAGSGTLGLRSMRERAEAAGGSVEIASALRSGTVVRAQIPLAPDSS